MRLRLAVLKVRRRAQLAAAAVAKEIGPREVAIALVTLGVYLVTRAAWPPGAAGLAVLAAGALLLWARLRAEDAISPRRGRDT